MHESFVTLMYTDGGLAAGLMCFLRCLSDSVHLDVESRLSGEFLGALDGQQLLVVEGSGVPESPGVYSQVT